MYEVSEAYKTQIKKVIRNCSYIRIRFGLVDPDAERHAVVSNNGQVPFSSNPEVIEMNTVADLYETLETNFWLLDGSMKVLPSQGEYLYQGFVSSSLSNENGAYTSTPIISVDFSAGAYAFKGLSFAFDTIQGTYPTQVTITGFLDGVQNYVGTFDISGPDIVLETNIPGNDTFVDKITVTANTLSVPGHRLRFSDLTLGLIKKIDSDKLSTSTWVRKSDLMNTVLPTNSFKFTFYDQEKEYNPDNPEGVWAYLETGQTVKFDYGYELDDGGIEWVQGSVLCTKGTPTIDNKGKIPLVSFDTVSRLQLLDNVYDEDVYTSTGRSLYSLANAILQWAGVTNSYNEPLYEIDSSLENYMFYGVLSAKPVKELLQLIANAGMCILTTDRSGKIVFVPRNVVATDFEYTGTDIYNNLPSISKFPLLKSLNLTATTYSIDDETTELASLDVVGAENAVYSLAFEAAVDISISTTGGLVLVSTDCTFSQKVIVTLSGTGKVIVSGKHIKKNNFYMSRQFNVDGTDCDISNELVNTAEHASAYLAWMSHVIEMRSAYKFSDRGFPEVDECDIVNLDTTYTEGKQSIVTATSITFNGTLKGETEVLS